jgi:hypothetical protein
VRVWHIDRAYSFKACMLVVSCLWLRWWVSLTEPYFVSLCLIVVLQVCSLSLPTWAVSEIGIFSARCRSWSMSDRFRKLFLFLILFLKFCNRIQNLNCNKMYLSKHFICLILVCDKLCIITSVMTSHNDAG